MDRFIVVTSPTGEAYIVDTDGFAGTPDAGSIVATCKDKATAIAVAGFMNAGVV